MKIGDTLRQLVKPFKSEKPEPLPMIPTVLKFITIEINKTTQVPDPVGFVPGKISKVSDELEKKLLEMKLAQQAAQKKYMEENYKGFSWANGALMGEQPSVSNTQQSPATVPQNSICKCGNPECPKPEYDCGCGAAMVVDCMCNHKKKTKSTGLSPKQIDNLLPLLEVLEHGDLPAYKSGPNWY